jgi:hypothetical protein
LEPLGRKCGSSSGVNGYLPGGIDMKAFGRICRKAGEIERVRSMKGVK